MFGWFKPTCPVDLREKVWTEQRFGWLVEQFGLKRMLDAEIILPTDEYFPDPYDGEQSDVRALLERVCGYMGVDAGKIDLEIYPPEDHPGAVGLYEPGERPKILVADSQLDDEEDLVATLAHEVAHDLLLGDGRLPAEDEDHEQVTDLLTVFLGIGVFAANTAVRQRSSRTETWEIWDIRKRGYLPARVLGYAFALMSWIRGDRTPAPWTEFLEVDARYAHRDALKYLLKTHECLLTQDGKFNGDRRPSRREVISDLRADSASRRLAAIWALGTIGDSAGESADALADCLRDQEPILRCEAARAVPAIANPPQEIIHELQNCLRDLDGPVRAKSAAALATLQVPLDAASLDGMALRTEFELLLDDHDSEVTYTVAGALIHYQSAAEGLARFLVPMLTKALHHCEYARIDYLLGTLMAIVPDVDGYLSNHLSARADLHQLAVDSLQQLQQLEEAEPQ